MDIIFLYDRAAQILLYLLNSNLPRTISQIQKLVMVSNRTVRYDLDNIDNFLTANGMQKLERKPRVGVSFIGSHEDRRRLKEILEGAEKYDFVFSPKASYNTGDQDFTAQLTNVSSANPDVIFAPGNYGESALLIKQARDQGITTPILGGDTWESPEFLSIGGDAVEGAVFSTHFTAEAPVTEVSEEFLAKYEEKFNKAANAFAALGYDAYMVILDAIERAGAATPEAIRDALSETEDFTGATGHITLDENGDAVKSAIIKKVENGDFVYLTTVEPK